MSQRKVANNIIHRDLSSAQMNKDERAVSLVTQWLEEMTPFNHANDKTVLMSFTTGFMSFEDDSLNTEKACEVGTNMQLALDEKTATDKMDNKK